MVNVVFVKAKGGGIGDWFTSLFNDWTGLWHCDFALPDGRRFGARPGGGAKIFTSGFGAYREIVLPVDVAAEALLPWLQKEDGSPYDYLGVLRFAVPFLRGSSDKWFCSELVAAALRDLAGWSIDPAKGPSLDGLLPPWRKTLMSDQNRTISRTRPDRRRAVSIATPVNWANSALSIFGTPQGKCPSVATK